MNETLIISTLGLDVVHTWPLQLCLLTSVLCWLVSILTNNVSQVDRLWTFMPVIYSAYYTFRPLLPRQQSFWLAPFNPSTDESVVLSPRAVLMFSLIVIWMGRLTYNTNRRGLFNLKDEDYRWAVLRQRISPTTFQIFNLTFIAFIQNFLLLSMNLPVKIASSSFSSSFELSDYYLTALTFIVLLLEFTADNQQYSFQTFKYATLHNATVKAANNNESNKGQQKGQHQPEERKAPSSSMTIKPYDESQQWPGARLSWTVQDAYRGFVTKGLWAYSRHPNFLCEQTFWWIMASFPLLGTSPPNIDLSKLYYSALLPILSLPVSDPSTWKLIYQDLVSPLWPILPPFALSLLFLSSTLFTESISSSKYPIAYRAYQQRVGMFVWSASKMLIPRVFGGEEELTALVWGDPNHVHAQGKH